jgi:hypothetical protein
MSAHPVNPLVADFAGETINRTKNVVTYLQFTADSYAANGSSASANDGLVLILEPSSTRWMRRWCRWHLRKGVRNEKGQSEKLGHDRGEI